MKTSLAYVALFLLSTVALVAAPKVAVLDAVLPEGIDREVAIGVTEKLSEQLVSSGKFMVLDRTTVGQSLKEIEFQTSGLVSDAEVKKAGDLLSSRLGASYVVVAQVSHIGGTYFVSAKMIDVRTGQITAQASEQAEGDVAVTLRIAEAAGAKLSAGLAASLVAKPDPLQKPGMVPQLMIDFDNDTRDRSPNNLRTSPTEVAFVTSPDGTTSGVFNGRNSRVEVDSPEEIGLTSMTLVVRLKSAFNKGWEAILDHRGWGNTKTHIQFPGNTIEVSFGANDPPALRPAFEFYRGVWYTIVLTYDVAAKLSVVYVNGEKIGSLAYRRCGPYIISRMDIGAWDGGDRYLEGQIDYLYLYKGAMSEQDVMSFYASLETR